MQLEDGGVRIPTQPTKEKQIKKQGGGNNKPQLHNNILGSRKWTNTSSWLTPLISPRRLLSYFWRNVRGNVQLPNLNIRKDTLGAKQFLNSVQ